MAKKNKMHQLAPKVDTSVQIIKGTTKCALGHQAQAFRCGVWQDGRQRRKRTRSAQFRASIGD